MDSNKEIGNRIKQIRLAEGLTMEEFGKLFKPEANKSLVSKWESGKSLPNNDRLKRITEIGEVSMKYLIEGSFDFINHVDLSEDSKEEYFSNAINFSKYKVIEKLANEYSTKNSIDSFEEARFLEEVLTFLDIYKKDPYTIGYEVLSNATQLFTILNLMNREFSNMELKNDFKLKSIDFHNKTFNKSANLVFDLFTEYLKNSYLD